MATRTTIYVVPRWGGTPSSDWYPWLAREIERRAVDLGQLAQVQRVEMPSPDVPVIGNWVFTLDRAVDRDSLEEAVLVGHSVGCQTVARWLAGLPEPRHVRGTLLIAPWFSVDVPWDTLRPWQETPFDFERAGHAAGRVSALLSNDDPFTADHDENARLWRDRVGADTRVLAARQHFNNSVEPDVLEALLELLG